ncbi:MAG: carbamoyltransferase [Candidatus Xenobia bacterium]
MRWRLIVRGTVQGVGFRPTVWNLASQLELTGFVRNDGGGVTIELQGPEERLRCFRESLPMRLPPRAKLDEVTQFELQERPEEGFHILQSAAEGQGALLPPDLATCGECLSELSDPADRRCGYPFLNCTHCGPRYTIVTALPYDRERTTMREFPLCQACRSEYENPADRRFHAQPTACPRCGPRLSLPVEQIRARLEQGQVLALKGLGGYHLICLAEHEQAVARLRRLKHRPTRPLALMVPDPAQWLQLTPELEELLRSPARPIVLARARRDVQPWAPGMHTLGVMLPYSALHHLICQRPLVVTSANLPGEPIATDNDPRLEQLADAVIHHDRPIAVGCDDSVLQWGPRGPVPVRRSRGYVPEPIVLSLDTVPTLALGGELKATLALTRGRQAFLSGHIGDVENLETLRRLEQNAEHLERLLDVKARLIAADMHPGYLSRGFGQRLAEQRDLPFVEVQHHHAHLASLLAEHGWPADRPLLGLILDGTGWGPDETLWGGEVLLGDYRGYERLAHLDPMPLRGGDSAIRNPVRQALEYLRESQVELDPRLPCVRAATELELANVGRGPALSTSSLGRLFDAVSSLLGICHRSSYEGQAAMELEAACLETDQSLEFPIRHGRIDTRPALRELACALLAGVQPGLLATRFHNGLAELMLRLARQFAPDRSVGLSGGCFQNMRLLGSTLERLERAGLEVLTHRLVPPNDGGLALGQAAIAQAHQA